MVPIKLIYHVRDTWSQVYNPISPMVRIFEPGFLPGFTWSQPGVFIDGADRCSCDHGTVLHVCSQCYYWNDHGCTCKEEICPLATLYGGWRLLMYWIILYYTVMFCYILNCIVLCYTVFYCTVPILYCFVLRDTTVLYIIQCYTVLSCAALYCIVLYYNTVLYCGQYTLLYCI